MARGEWRINVRRGFVTGEGCGWHCQVGGRGEEGGGEEEGNGGKKGREEGLFVLNILKTINTILLINILNLPFYYDLLAPHISDDLFF